MKTCPACGGTEFYAYHVTEKRIVIDGNGAAINETPREFSACGNTWIDYGDEIECAHCGWTGASFDAIPGEVEDPSGMELKE